MVNLGGDWMRRVESSFSAAASQARTSKWASLHEKRSSFSRPLQTRWKNALDRSLSQPGYDSGGAQQENGDRQGHDDAMHDSLSLRGDH